MGVVVVLVHFLPRRDLFEQRDRFVAIVPEYGFELRNGTGKSDVWVLVCPVIHDVPGRTRHPEGQFGQFCPRIHPLDVNDAVEARHDVQKLHRGAVRESLLRWWARVFHPAVRQALDANVIFLSKYAVIGVVDLSR